MQAVLVVDSESPVAVLHQKGAQSVATLGRAVATVFRPAAPNTAAPARRRGRRGGTARRRCRARQRFRYEAGVGEHAKQRLAIGMMAQATIPMDYR